MVSCFISKTPISQCHKGGSVWAQLNHHGNSLSKACSPVLFLAASQKILYKNHTKATPVFLVGAFMYFVWSFGMLIITHLIKISLKDREYFCIFWACACCDPAVTALYIQLSWAVCQTQEFYIPLTCSGESPTHILYNFSFSWFHSITEGKGCKKKEKKSHICLVNVQLQTNK